MYLVGGAEVDDALGRKAGLNLGENNTEKPNNFHCEVERL